MKLVIFIFILGVSTFSYGSTSLKTECDTFRDGELVELYTIYLNKIKRVNPLWDNFSTSNHLLLLTADDYQNCLIGFYKDIPSATYNVSKEVLVEDWMAIDIDFPTYPPLKVEVIDIVKSYGQSKAIVINISKHIFSRLEITFHEMFHHFYQIDSRMPVWWKHIDRERLSQACYHAYGEGYKSEANLLIAAYDLLLGGHTQTAKSILKYYLDAREQRYQKLIETRIESNGQIFTCEEAEANMEFLEGQAQFFGERGVIELGLTSRYSIARDYKYSLEETDLGWIEPFYYFGSLQLHIIRLLNQETFNGWNSEVYKSKRYSDSLFYKKIKSLL